MASQQGKNQNQPAPVFSDSWNALLEAATPAQAKQLHAAAKRAGDQFDLLALSVASTDSQAETLRTVAAAADEAARAAWKADKGQRHREKMAERSRERSAHAKEIGPLPPVEDPARKEACRFNLRLFYETYFPDKFFRAFCQDELDEIEALQQSILDPAGGFDVFADPRASGKSTRCEIALLWAIVYGHHSYAGIIPAQDEMAGDALAGLLFVLETNERLAADFPEVCHPIKALEGHHNRANGQTLNGERTFMRFTKKKFVFPTVPGSAASGAVLFAAGLESAVRGTRHHLRDGRTIRPTLLMIDDPQTRETAESEQQTSKRERILTADLLGCAPAGGHMTVLCAVTVIAQADLADRLLDKNRHPQIRQHRHKLLYEFPTDFTADQSAGHWDHYFELVTEDLRRRGCKKPFARATKYYAQHREAMDAGAVVGNPYRLETSELSAVQHAMNLYFRCGPEGFATEYNNEPLQPGEGDVVALNAARIAVKLSDHAAGDVPLGVQWVTAFADVHNRVLFWMVCGWEPDFTGYVLDYGAWPKPGRSHFTQQNARPALQQHYPNRGPEGAIYAGLRELYDTLCGRDWKRKDGVPLRIGHMAVDAGFAGKVVRKSIRESQHRAVLIPSFGRAIGANEVPISEFRAKPGEFISPEEWLVRGRSRAGMHLIFDANVWKSNAAARLLTEKGDPGSLTLPGSDPKRDRHEFLAEHFTGEKRERIKGRREADQWTAVPGRQNHWWDCLVGCCVGASRLGARLGQGKQLKPRKQRERATIV